MSVLFEEGDEVQEGANLVLLDNELLRKTLDVVRASYEQALREKEKAQADLDRAEELFKDNTIPEQQYDDAYYAYRILEPRVNALKAEVERVETEIEKTSVQSPFNGIVLERMADTGEWVSQGTEIAVIARSGSMEIMVDIPGDILPYQKKAMTVSVTVGGSSKSGTLDTIIPRGDIRTRTFPVKIVLHSSEGLAEGMEATATLPVAAPKQCLLMPRDALISKFGQQVVYTVEEGVAKMYPVQVVGYDGLNAGVPARGLASGMNVIIKGNERIQEGHPAIIIPEEARTGTSKPGKTAPSPAARRPE